MEDEKRKNDSELNKGLHKTTVEVKLAEVDTLIELMTKKKEYELVDKKHVNKNGTKRKLTYLEPTETYPNGKWQTKLIDGKNIYAKTEEELIHKLYMYYNDNDNTYVFKNIFIKELDSLISQGKIVEKTYTHHMCTYKRTISDELSNMDIRKITPEYMGNYTFNLVTHNEMTEKAFKAYKGVLNIVFNAMPEIPNPIIKMKNQVYYKHLKIKTAEEKMYEFFSEEDIERLINEVARRRKQKKYGEYYINGFVMLIAIKTGMRVAELCALHWSDIHWEEGYIHIHRQQLSTDKTGDNRYYEVPWLKNEKGVRKGGRKFPLTDEIKEILTELKELQTKYHHETEYVFTNEANEWVKVDAYETFLRRICRSLDLASTHNHAFRKSLNSLVLVPLGIDAPDRAELLGHSVETNLKYYTFAKRDTVDKARNLINNLGKNQKTQKNPEKLVFFTQQKSSEAFI